MATGYVKMHREVMDHEVFRNPWLWKLFSWCIMRAKYINSSDSEVPRGAFTIGRIQAACELHASPSAVYRGLKTLEKLGCISTKSNSRFTLISVCNYETYQDGACIPEQPVNSQRTAGEQPADSQRTAGEQPADSQRTAGEHYKKEGKKGRREEGKNTLPPDLDNEAFQTTLADWIAYKGKKYKPQGLKSLISRASTLANTHGLPVVIEAFRTAMANGWQGWDQPSIFEKAPKLPQSRLPNFEEERETWTPHGGGE